MSTAIVTDSAADIPADLLKKNNITEVPVIVNFGDESFKENVDLSADEFYHIVLCGFFFDHAKKTFYTFYSFWFRGGNCKLSYHSIGFWPSRNLF